MYLSTSLTVVVTINISVKPRPCLVTPHKVKKPVSSLPGELVCSEERKRRRIKCNNLLVCAVLGLVVGKYSFALRRLWITALFSFNRQSNFTAKNKCFSFVKHYEHLSSHTRSRSFGNVTP